MLEGTDVTIEKRQLIATIVEPAVTPAATRKVQQKQPDLSRSTADSDRHLEEVDLPTVTRPMDQRNEDLRGRKPKLTHHPTNRHL